MKIGDIYLNTKEELCEILAVAEHRDTHQNLVIYKMVETDRIYAIEESVFAKEFEETSDRAMRNQKRLVEFLDIDGAEGKIIFLQRHKAELNEEFLEIAAQCLDFVDKEGDFEEHYQGLIKFLQTQAKFEFRRR